MVYQHYMNSSDASTFISPNVLLHLSDPNESDVDERPLSARKLVRVDGSATLSAICDDEDDEDDDDDQFGIDGAELVDEEEAVQVRSFGRSFGQVRLATPIAPPTLCSTVSSPSQLHQKPPSRSKQRFDAPILRTPPHAWQKDSALCIGSACDSAELDGNDVNTEDGSTPLDSYEQCLQKPVVPDRFCNENIPRHKVHHQVSIPDPDEDSEIWPGFMSRSEACAVQKRKSRLLLPFSRRSSAVGSSRNGDCRSATGAESGGFVSTLMCFPTRRATFRAQCLLRERHRDPEAAINGADARSNVRSGRNTSARRNHSPQPSGQKNTQPGLTAQPSQDTNLVSSITTTPTDYQIGEGIAENGDSQDDETNRRKIVKNVSLQRDDWIEFTTSSSAGRRKTAWIVRLLSSGPLDITVSRSRLDQENEEDDDDDDDFEYMCGQGQREGVRRQANRQGGTKADGSSGNVRTSTSNYISGSGGNGEADEGESVSSRRSGRKLWRLWPRRAH